MASSLSYSHMITSLESALKLVHRLANNNAFANKPGFEPPVIWSMKIGVRNLKALIVCLGKLDADGALLIGTVYKMLVSHEEDSLYGIRRGQYVRSEPVLEDLHGVWRQLSNGGMNQPCRQLEADEVLSIIVCVIQNTADFLAALSCEQIHESVPVAFEVLESFHVQMRFLGHLVLFAMQAGVEDSLLFHVQPIAIKAATVFTQIKSTSLNDIIHRPVQHFLFWFKEVESKCWTVNRMAADPQVWQAHARALTALSESAALHSAFGYDADGEDIFKAFLDSFISLLWDILRRQSESRLKDQYKLVYEKLRRSRAIWKKNGTDKKTKGQIGVLICDAGAFIFMLHQTDPGRFEDLLERFDAFHAQFELETIPSFKVDHVHEKGISTGGDSTSIKISDDGNGRDLNYSSPTSSHQHQHPYSHVPQVVGFKEDELQLLLNRLTRGSKELCIVPICGMPGLGKTTLALELYNHPSVKARFQARAWCPISQVLDKKRVLVQLLNQIQPGGDYSKEPEPDLADKLRRSLKGKPYLILLDDIWIADVWDTLKASFPNDSTRSRIIFTSRSLDIVPHAQHDQKPHSLRLRSDSECFDILETKLAHKKSWNTKLVMEIAEKCNGLPLTVTIVAGLLATSEPESWKGILDHLSSGGASGCAESALEFSYRHLPDCLKPCFLYFGVFPEDEEVPVWMLIRLWMAEGFVGKEESKRIEDVAREYVEKLIERSLVMAVESRSIGRVSSCRIHDVVHDFCRSKAKQEHIFHLLLQSQDELSDFNEPSSLQRLFIHSTTTHFMETRLFCPRAQSMFFFTPAGRPNMESHFLDMSFIIQIFHSLKVLDMTLICLMNDIPSGIQFLTQLRYFAITSYVPVIPSSIGNLSNLETFIVRFYNEREYYIKGPVEQVSFPDTLWNLQKLRYLRVRGRLLTLPVDNLDNSSSLLELETLDGACFYYDDGSMEKQMKKFPNVRTLKCTIRQRSEFPPPPGPSGGTRRKFEEVRDLSVHNVGLRKSELGFRHMPILQCFMQCFQILGVVPPLLDKIVIPEFLSQLESLTMQGVRGNGCVKFELGSSAENLRKIKLKEVQLSREVIATIGRVPNLEVLILSDILFTERQLEMQEEEFTKLRILKLLSSHNLERWTCSDDQAFCLEKLVFSDCSNLTEIPCLLGDISTLEQIEVEFCPPILESAVRNIEEVQKDYGNRVKVHI